MMLMVKINYFKFKRNIIYTRFAQKDIFDNSHIAYLYICILSYMRN